MADPCLLRVLILQVDAIAVVNSELVQDGFRSVDLTGQFLRFCRRAIAVTGTNPGYLLREGGPHATSAPTV
jgi:hypothetical protein